MLRIAAEDYDVGHCRNVDIQVLSAYTSEEIPIGDQICFVPVAGHLVAQLRPSGQVQFYQQALFKFDQQSMSFCEEIWTDPHGRRTRVWARPGRGTPRTQPIRRCRYRIDRRS